MPIHVGMMSKTWLAAGAAVVFVAGLGVGVASSPATAEQSSSDVAAAPVRLPLVDRIDNTPPKPEPTPPPRLEQWKFRVASVSPDSSSKQGVGTILRVTFEEPIPSAARWKVQDGLEIKSTNSKQDLSAPWVWLNDSTLAYRPQDFWLANQTVSVASTWPVDQPLMRISEKADKKKVGHDDLVEVVMGNAVAFEVRIGRSQILKIDGAKHQAVVQRDGKRIKEVPVSLGKSGWETASGIKTMMESYEVKRLYNPGPNGWDVTTPYAIRLTITGEFLHSAPWNGSIGYANTSHGCTNMTISDAKWFYENSLRGDPVITVNGGAEPAVWDGDGAPWNVSWSSWKAMASPTP